MNMTVKGTNRRLGRITSCVAARISRSNIGGTLVGCNMVTRGWRFIIFDRGGLSGD